MSKPKPIPSCHGPTYPSFLPLKVGNKLMWPIRGADIKPIYHKELVFN